ncbi:cysteine-rich KTR domain-containing protein [Barnesiella intestinihominis]|uniref:cysteine-rich KTR domain-containing protein n=1 Tax=Barnesiella intestinihominis TaxID=487174 RepID=UPI003BB8A1F6
MLCPICNNKTRIKVRPDTVLENFPLFCPKCKQETIISVTGQNVVAVKKSENAI